jgi:hypothetical protein
LLPSGSVRRKRNLGRQCNEYKRNEGKTLHGVNWLTGMWDRAGFGRRLSDCNAALAAGGRLVRHKCTRRTARYKPIIAMCVSSNVAAPSARLPWRERPAPANGPAVNRKSLPTPAKLLTIYELGGVEIAFRC